MTSQQRALDQCTNARQLVVAYAAIVLLLTVHCDSGRPRDRTDTTGATSGHEIQPPDSGTLEPAVAEQLEAVRERLAQATSAEEFGDCGLTYLAYDFLGPASACFERATTLSPQTYEWHHYLGLTLQKGDEPSRAIAAFENALTVRPDNTAARIHAGRLHLTANNLIAAERHFESARGDEKALSAAEIGLGRIALQRRQFAKSRDLLEAALQRTPNATEACYSLGLSYRGLGDDAKARMWMQRQGESRASVPDPLQERVAERVRGYRLHNDLGLRYFQAGDYPTAISYFREAVQAAPDKSRLQMNLASALTRLGEEWARSDPQGGSQLHTEAKQRYERAIDLDPNNAVALYTYGTFLARKRFDDEAVSLYERALAVDPHNPDCHFNLANALRRLHRFERADSHYARVIDLQPSNPTARFARSLTLLRLDRVEEAFKLLDESHAALPDDVRIANALARVLAAAPDGVAKLRDGKRALGLAEKLRAHENSVTHVATLAMALAAVGRFEEAERETRAAIAAVERSPEQTDLPELREMVAAFVAKRGWHRPWPKGHPLLSP